jgi:hypothetical protein
LEACDAAAANRHASAKVSPPVDPNLSGPQELSSQASRPQAVAEAIRSEPAAPVSRPLQTFARPAVDMFSTPAPAIAARAEPADSIFKDHPSPSVRMAAKKTEQAQAAKTTAQTVVVVASNKAKGIMWKAGAEKDGKGFNRTTWLAVQRSWEENNSSEEAYNYRTLRSQIHPTMIPIVQMELSLTRQQWDALSDPELIMKLDKIFEPFSTAEYIIKLRQIVLEKDETKGNLLDKKAS